MSNEIRNSIKEHVASGIKGTELIIKVAVDVQGKIEWDVIVTVLKEMVANGEIVEVEYVLPHMSYRVKSFYLPAGTDVRILTKNDAEKPQL